MTLTVSLLGTLGTLSLSILLYILARLSERFGSVIKMRPFYRYYYLALVFLVIGYVAHLTTAMLSTPENISTWLATPWFLLLAYHLPTTIGLTVGLVVTWRYWSWLVIENDG